MKARVAAAVCVAVMLGTLGSTTGCAGGRGDREADGKSATGTAAGSAVTRSGAPGPGEPAEPEETEGPAVTGDDRGTPRLRGVELGKDEVPGLVIEQAQPGTAGRGMPVADSPECRPLAVALGSRPQPQPLGSVVTTFAGEQDGPDEGLLGTVRVAEYRPGDAVDTFRSLEEAAEDCAGGFGMRTGEGERQMFDAVESVPAPRLGDEAAAYRLTNAVEEAPTLITVVRSGDVLSMFFATSLGDPQQTEIPERLVTAQVRKVEAAARPEGAGPERPEAQEVQEADGVRGPHEADEAAEAQEGSEG
ncbi:hypothetical protein [Streptomyces sp. I05A-00742]|uniref:hypothetical protein n=1 Tax=Streptomyces sp. I05A-00742 TaxID=2732853 RepID=UPI001488454B|nr:hypothetical protein [Streptomyces sp. I05A-00742]